MRTRLFAVLALLIVGAGLPACVSLERSPDARFFVLRSMAEPPATPAPAAPVGIVGVLPVRLPGALERPQVVRWRGPDELGVNEFVRWAEPLDAGSTRTLAENLAVLLPEYRVMETPWPGWTRMRCRVAVELSVFGLQADGTVALEGRWSLLPEGSERPLVMESVSLASAPPPSASAGAAPEAEVDGMSRQLAHLGRRIADAIRALPVQAEVPGTGEKEERPGGSEEP
jgi:uncharacterized lipoprotein YmbA